MLPVETVPSGMTEKLLEMEDGDAGTEAEDKPGLSLEK